MFSGAARENSKSVGRCILAAMCVAMIVLAHAGCRARQLPRTTRIVQTPPDDRPSDLAMAATVFGPRVPLPDVALPRSLQPARYIIEADGVLRAGKGSVGYPPAARRLTPRQRDQLWRVIRDSGLLDEGNPAQIEDPEEAVRSGDKTTAMMYISYGGKRMTLRVLLDRSSNDAIEAERFVDRLAELAWIR